MRLRSKKVLNRREDAAKDCGLLRSHFDPLTVGTGFGILSALAYTGANIALKQVAGPGDFDWAIWVSCIKAVPTALTAWALVGYRALRGLPALPPRQLVVPLLLMGLFMQFGGNVMFQWSLGLVGLALTVPVSFATLILSTAVCGRLFLAEPITARTAAAMGTLILSIVFLSVGVRNATESVAAGSSWLMGGGAILAACTAGIAYGMSSVTIRWTLARGVSHSATLVLLATSGVVGLGLLSLSRMGLESLKQTPISDLQIMLLAGVLNAIAFFSLSAALKHITTIRANLLNTSQTALAAAAGVLWFAEPLTAGLIIGTALTVAGLLLMENRRAQRRMEDGR